MGEDKADAWLYAIAATRLESLVVGPCQQRDSLEREEMERKRRPAPTDAFRRRAGRTPPRACREGLPHEAFEQELEFGGIVVVEIRIGGHLGVAAAVQDGRQGGNQ